MGILRFFFFFQNCSILKLYTCLSRKMLIEHQVEEIKGIFEERINRNQRFLRHEAINLENLGCNPFPSRPSAALDTYF